MSGVRRFSTSLRRVFLRKKLFDAAFYLERYPDVGAARMHPFAHYLLHGAPEGAQAQCLVRAYLLPGALRTSPRSRRRSVCRLSETWREGKFEPASFDLRQARSESGPVTGGRPVHMRFVILHYHFLKSAGMAIEDMLRRSFEKNYASIDTPESRRAHVHRSAALAAQ